MSENLAFVVAKKYVLCKGDLPLLARDYLQRRKMIGKFIDHCLNFADIFCCMEMACHA